MGRGFFGSRAVCGLLAPEDLELRDAAGVSVREALADLGLSPERALRSAARLGFFVELHIEQRPALDALDVPLGIVTDIVGRGGCEIVFEGAAAHAGTTPLGARADALCAAAVLVLALREAAAAEADAVATVAALTVEPGASNVVPARVRLSVDVRSRSSATLARLIGGSSAWRARRPPRALHLHDRGAVAGRPVPLHARAKL